MEDSKAKLFRIMGYLDESFKLIENTDSNKFYGIFNIHGDYNNGKPLYIITDTKEDMCEKLNEFIVKNLPKNEQFTYDNDDFEEQTYMGEILDTYISDDWAIVTYKEDVFNHYFNEIKNQINTPELYK